MAPACSTAPAVTVTPAPQPATPVLYDTISSDTFTSDTISSNPDPSTSAPDECSLTPRTTSDTDDESVESTSGDTTHGTYGYDHY